MNTGTKVTTGATATTHDIELTDEVLEQIIRESRNSDGTLEFARRIARAAIKADREHRGEPMGRFTGRFTGEVNGDVLFVVKAYGAIPAPGAELYTAPQPAEPSRSEPGVSTTQVLITLGKVIAGYRPGEEGWSEYDQQAYDAAMSTPQPLSESDIPAEPVNKERVGWRYRIKPNEKWTLTDTKPTGIPTGGQVQEVWVETAEPVVAEFPVKGKLHGPLGWIANTTNPEPVNSDRRMLLKLMEAFDIETWQCPSCGHTEDTATMDSAYMLRDYLKDATVAEPVKVDAKASVQSDDALDDALSNLEHVNYEQSYSGYKNRQADIALIRTAPARYGNTQQEK